MTSLAKQLCLTDSCVFALLCRQDKAKGWVRPVHLGSCDHLLAVFPEHWRLYPGNDYPLSWDSCP